MGNDLLQTIALDLGIILYSNESEVQFHNRVIYSAIACWIKTASQDKPVNNASSNGVSKRHIHDKCFRVLSAFLERYRSSIPWFTTDDTSDDAVSLIRSRLLRHQDILNVGFNTNVTISEVSYEWLSSDLETVRGMILFPGYQYNGISMLRKPKSVADNPSQELIHVSKWMDEYIKSAWWETIDSNMYEALEYFDASRKSSALYKCWQTVKPKTEKKYILARRPTSINSHEYILINIQSGKMHRIDPILKEFGEHRRFMYGFRAEMNNCIPCYINIYPEYVHLRMGAYMPNKETQLLESLAWPHNNITDRLEWDMSMSVWNYIKPLLLALGMVFMEDNHG